MHPIKSIEARAQAYTLAHFSRSKYAKRLAQLKNIHSDETCFIVGNGPSLTADDLSMMKEKGIPSFAFNKIFLIFDKTDWRPTYYVSQDEKTLMNCTKEVNAMQVDIKFIPLIHKYYHYVDIENAYYFQIKNTDLIHYDFSDDISEFIGNSSTVAFSAAQIAAYMGFKRIYLLGIDHQFSRFKNEAGELIIDKSVKDYFADNYHDSTEKDLNTPNPDVSTRAFLAMKAYCDKHGIEVYNATRGGKLEVFPRADFDKVINEL